MIAVVESDCFRFSQEATLLAVITIRFLCYQINAEARIAQKGAALRRPYVFLGYSLHVRLVLSLWKDDSVIPATLLLFQAI